MDFSPFFAQGGQFGGQGVRDATHLGPRKSVVLAQLWRSLGAVQIEHALASGSDDVDVRGSMIVRIDNHAQAIETKDRRHAAL
jgi:hypothetical protein